MTTFLYPLESIKIKSDPRVMVRIITSDNSLEKKSEWEKVKINGQIMYSRRASLYIEDLREELMKTDLREFSDQFSKNIIKGTNGKFIIPKFMGILNITPDSFYSGSRFTEPEKMKNLISTKPDILDVGAESTRPGAVNIGVIEEKKRLSSFFGNIDHGNIEVSLDTRNPSTANHFSDEIDYINDIGGFTLSDMMEIAKRERKKCIVMHMKGTPETMSSLIAYDDPVAEIIMFFYERIKAMTDFGISPESIIIDPGIGFAKAAETSIEIISKAISFNIGVPVLFGTSRKSFIKKITGSEVKERLPETIATSLYLATKGIEILRVHDVNENRNALLTMQQLTR
ncbi:MAG: dihydropteroate synthase [Thermoplasmataceae archaeon]